MSQRFAQCDTTCTTDCGHCKGQGAPVSTRYQAAKRVVETHTFDPDFEGVLLDQFTASALVAVFEALSPANQAAFDKVPLATLVDFCLSKVA